MTIQFDPFPSDGYNYRIPIGFQLDMEDSTLPVHDDLGSVSDCAGVGAMMSSAGCGGPDTGSGVKVISAGGLVFRKRHDSIETLLCARAKPGLPYDSAPLTWRLPKGTPERGESVEETACREVQEETGVLVNVVAPITSIRYFFVGHDDGVRYDKTVYFYLMEPRGGDTADHDAEFDVVEWLSYEQALEALEYDNERNVLEAARSLIDAYPESGAR